MDDAGAEEDEEDGEDDPGEVLRRYVVAQVLVQPQPEVDAIIRFRKIVSISEQCNNVG